VTGKKFLNHLVATTKQKNLIENIFGRSTPTATTTTTTNRRPTLEHRVPKKKKETVPAMLQVEYRCDVGRAAFAPASKSPILDERDESALFPAPMSGSDDARRNKRSLSVSLARAAPLVCHPQIFSLRDLAERLVISTLCDRLARLASPPPPPSSVAPTLPTRKRKLVS
jgi:hypothetical protein